MEAPKRIMDDPAADTTARALIEDARLETASPTSKARALAALGLVGATGVATTSSAFLGLKALGIGVLAVGVGVGATWALLRADAPAPAASGRVSAVALVAPSPPAPVAPSPPVPVAPSPPVLPVERVEPAGARELGEPAPKAEGQRVVTRSVARAPAASAAPAPSASASAAPSRLAEEARSLEVVRRELEARRSAPALASLDRYERDFPRGELRPEAMALRVEALAASGDDVSARALGRQFLARFPGHPAASRVRRAMGETNP